MIHQAYVTAWSAKEVGAFLDLPRGTKNKYQLLKSFIHQGRNVHEEFWLLENVMESPLSVLREIFPQSKDIFQRKHSTLLSLFFLPMKHNFINKRSSFV